MGAAVLKGLHKVIKEHDISDFFVHLQTARLALHCPSHAAYDYAPEKRAAYLSDKKDMATEMGFNFEANMLSALQEKGKLGIKSNMRKVVKPVLTEIGKHSTPLCLYLHPIPLCSYLHPTPLCSYLSHSPVHSWHDYGQRGDRLDGCLRGSSPHHHALHVSLRPPYEGRNGRRAYLQAQLRPRQEHEAVCVVSQPVLGLCALSSGSLHSSQLQGVRGGVHRDGSMDGKRYVLLLV